MLRLNIKLALSGLVALAAGLLGGWALFVGLPPQDSALAALKTASSSIAMISSAGPASAASPAAPGPGVETPPPAPSASAPEAAPAKDADGKPHIHLDGERSALSYEGEAGGFSLNKDRLSLRTPFGKFDLDW